MPPPTRPDDTRATEATAVRGEGATSGAELRVDGMERCMLVVSVAMFSKSAAFYDAIYAASGKDYTAEAAWLRAAIGREVGDRARLLDVACGTGMHLAMLRGDAAVEGLDADAAMVALARERLPDVPLHVARMQDFRVAGRFDVALCMFSSIGYVRDEADLRATCRNVAAHLAPGGAFFLEPWLRPSDWRDGALDAVFVDEPKLKIARMGTSERYGDTSVVRFEYLVSEPDGMSRFAETHVLQLFTDAQYRAAMVDAGFAVRSERSDQFERGLFIAVKP
jgi:SAM-dependent methyltransferase